MTQKKRTPTETFNGNWRKKKHFMLGIILLICKTTFSELLNKTCPAILQVSITLMAAFNWWASVSTVLPSVLALCLPREICSSILTYKGLSTCTSCHPAEIRTQRRRDGGKVGWFLFPSGQGLGSLLNDGEFPSLTVCARIYIELLYYQRLFSNYKISFYLLIESKRIF